jgi:hypothetical protein
VIVAYGMLPTALSAWSEPDPPADDLEPWGISTSPPKP